MTRVNRTTLDTAALTLGSVELLLGGRRIGEVKDFSLAEAIDILNHRTNVDTEYTKDHAVNMESNYSMNCTWGEITPHAFNAMMGFPGYEIESGNELRDEYVTFNDADGNNNYVPLLMPPVPANTGAPQVSSDGISLTSFGTPDTGGANLAKVLYWAAGWKTGVGVGPLGEYLLVEHDDGNTTVVLSVDTTALTAEGVATHIYLYKQRLTLTDSTFIYGTDSPLDDDPKLDQSVAIANPTAITDAAMDAVAIIGTDFPGLFTVKQLGVPGGSETLVDTNDYVVDYSANAIRRAVGSSLGANEIVHVYYYIDLDNSVKAVIGPRDNVRFFPVTFKHIYPDKQSSVVFHFHKCMIQTEATVAFTPDQFIGVPANIMVYDNSKVTPTEPMGWCRFFGPMADKVNAQGNVPFAGAGGTGLASDQQAGG